MITLDFGLPCKTNISKQNILQVRYFTVNGTELPVEIYFWYLYYCHIVFTVNGTELPVEIYIWYLYYCHAVC